MIELRQIKEQLKFSVEHFKEWVNANHSDLQIKEGNIDDCGYPEWQKLEDLCEEIFTSLIFKGLETPDKKRIVFIIGRQWDLGRILNWFNKGTEEIGQLGMTKEQLFELSNVAVTEDDIDAKGQFAASLFKVGDTPEVVELLLKFHADQDEYVRRQALSSLDKIGYSKIGELIVQSWKNDQEFEKIMCLNLMKDLNHEKFEVCLDEALSDEREYLRKRAVELKNIDYTM
ncbi:MAG: HEAT repeat domain-containing protein [Crocinitomicaceae bacterium]|nr:HEAT repeat domain-containing protein [Flavobacteriales bacterium]NQZ35233.1 HEAT repeat domain-containing protein [Crocinitomicaceae bacterium]